MNRLKFLLTVTMVTLATLVFGQPVEMADTMRSEGKIYVVVAIVLVIFIGLIIYLVMLDRKITQIEKKLPEKKESGVV